MSLLWLLLAGLVLVWIAVVWWSAHLLIHPPRRTFASAVARGLPADPGQLPGLRRRWREDVLPAGEGVPALPLWIVEGDDPQGPTVVCVHGWGDSRVGALLRAPAILPHARRVIMFDLPAHGEAPGRCSLGRLEARALRRVLAHAQAHTGDGTTPGPSPPWATVLFGWSLGAGVCIEVAAGSQGQVTIAGVIAEAPYRRRLTPARNVLRLRRLPHRLTLRPALLGALAWLWVRDGLGPREHRGFDRARDAARLGCPLLVIHGTDDMVCPIEDGQALAAAAPRGRLVAVAGAGHNDLWTVPAFAARATEAIAGFLSELRHGHTAVHDAEYAHRP